MSTRSRTAGSGIFAALVIGMLAASSLALSAQTSRRDGIGDLINRDTSNQSGQAKGDPQTSQGGQPQPAEKDPREGDATYEQARRLMQAIDSVLQDAARNRNDARRLPSKDEFIVAPLWTETREDRERKVRELLDSAMAIVTDVPIVEIQKRIDERRRTIRDLEDRIARLREKQLLAPKDGLLPGVITDTVESLGRDVEDIKKRIESNRADIKTAKTEVADALQKSGIKLSPEQVEMLLDSVLSGDLVRLVAVFNSAKLVDAQLAKLMNAAGENISAARKYFAMHAALFALLVHAQDMLIAKIDTNYLPKLDAISGDIGAARKKTAELLQAENRPDQKRALEGNRQSQLLAEEAAKAYRRYLAQQREQIAAARRRGLHDLRIADNTFETVEASFQLRNLMRDSSSSFEALQKLEAPTFEQIFKNEELRREFESLTRKLDAPSS